MCVKKESVVEIILFPLATAGDKYSMKSNLNPSSDLFPALVFLAPQVGRKEGNTCFPATMSPFPSILILHGFSSSGFMNVASERERQTQTGAAEQIVLCTAKRRRRNGLPTLTDKAVTSERGGGDSNKKMHS